MSTAPIRILFLISVVASGCNRLASDGPKAKIEPVRSVGDISVSVNQLRNLLEKQGEKAIARAERAELEADEHKEAALSRLQFEAVSMQEALNRIRATPTDDDVFAARLRAWIDAATQRRLALNDAQTATAALSRLTQQNVKQDDLQQALEILNRAAGPIAANDPLLRDTIEREMFAEIQRALQVKKQSDLEKLDHAISKKQVELQHGERRLAEIQQEQDAKTEQSQDLTTLLDGVRSSLAEEITKRDNLRNQVADLQSTIDRLHSAAQLKRADDNESVVRNNSEFPCGSAANPHRITELGLARFGEGDDEDVAVLFGDLLGDCFVVFGMATSVDEDYKTITFHPRNSRSRICHIRFRFHASYFDRTVLDSIKAGQQVAIFGQFDRLCLCDGKGDDSLGIEFENSQLSSCRFPENAEAPHFGVDAIDQKPQASRANVNPPVSPRAASGTAPHASENKSSEAAKPKTTGRQNQSTTGMPATGTRASSKPREMAADTTRDVASGGRKAAVPRVFTPATGDNITFNTRARQEIQSASSYRPYPKNVSSNFQTAYGTATGRYGSWGR